MTLRVTDTRFPRIDLQNPDVPWVSVQISARSVLITRRLEQRVGDPSVVIDLVEITSVEPPSHLEHLMLHQVIVHRQGDLHESKAQDYLLDTAIERHENRMDAVETKDGVLATVDRRVGRRTTRDPRD